MAEDIMADDDEKKPRLSGAAWHQNRAQKEVDGLKRKLASLKETVARGNEAQEQIPDVRKPLDLAEARLSAESREVAITNVPALKVELASICARMDASYSTEAERRIHEILSAARACGASGQSWEQYKLATARIKSGTTNWRWTMFVDWIREPAKEAA
jgi:chromosome segregation ATPase